MPVQPTWQQRLDGGAAITIVVTAETAQELDAELVTAINWLARARQMARLGDRLAGQSEVEMSLSPREYQVAAQAARGLTNRQIGQHLGIATHTVEAHMKRVYHKLGVDNRASLTTRVNGIGK